MKTGECCARVFDCFLSAEPALLFLFHFQQLSKLCSQLTCISLLPRYFHCSAFIILCFYFFLHSVCPTCCSASPSLRPSWCLWWTCLHPPNILHSPPSISCLLEPFSSSSSSFLDHQPLQCSLWNPRFVWSDLQSSSFRSEMRSLVWLHQTGWERWPGRREPLPVDKEKTSWKKKTKKKNSKVAANSRSSR